MSSLFDLLRRLRSSLGWVAAQFWATLLLVLACIGWTRIPDSHGWQVALTLLLPLLLLAALLTLQAGTMRKLSGETAGRVRFFWGALTLLAWVAVICAVWMLLDWCNDQTIPWASYLNSKVSAGGRQTIFTYDHLQRWLTALIWIVRWIALPAKIIPYAMSSAEWGWRLPWRKIIRLLLHLRWWLAVVAGALLAVDLPPHFFAGLPRGTVSHQIGAVGLKLAGTYLIAVSVWVLLLTWCAVLLHETKQKAELPAEEAGSPVPVGPGPLGEDSVRLPLPEGDDHLGGNA